MIFITKFEPPKDIFSNLYEFALNTFDIKYDEGNIYINGKISPTSYGDTYTEQEAIKDFIKGKWFREFCRSRHYHIYKIEVL